MTMASPRTGAFEQVEYAQPINNNTSLSGNNAVPPSLEPQTTPTTSPVPEPTMLDLHRQRRLVESRSGGKRWFFPRLDNLVAKFDDV